MKKCEIIAIANQKGGVGKTTTAVNLAAALSVVHHKKVLLIDMDSQGNATTSAGLDKQSLEYTMADVFADGVMLDKAIVSTPTGFDMVGANKELSGLDIIISEMDNSALILQEVFADGILDRLEYDYVLMDCAPSLSLVTVNALCATDGVIIPMQCEYYALEGVADLTHTIEKLKAINPKLHIRGVVRTLYDNRNMLAQDVSDELSNHFGELLYKTIIPRNIRLAEAPSFGQTIFEFQKSSKGARAYQNLSNEVIGQSMQPSLLS